LSLVWLEIFRSISKSPPSAGRLSRRFFRLAKCCYQNAAPWTGPGEKANRCAINAQVIDESLTSEVRGR
jgi:hypothetical protein